MMTMQQIMAGWMKACAVIMAGFVLVACETVSTIEELPLNPFSDGDVEDIPDDMGYRLDAGDKLRVTVFGDDSVSGEFEVDSTGKVAMPLVGEVEAADLSLREFEESLRTALEEEFFKNPSVSVEVLNYRPLFVEGQVLENGEIDYSNGMTVRIAIAKAGGFTDFARRDEVRVVRGGTEYRVNELDQTMVLPGDVIRVNRRII